MAEETNDKQNSQNINSNSSGAKSNTFQKGLVKDFNETFVGEGLYTHARNAINNTHDGQIGVIGNEPSNLFCYQFPYSVIGAIFLYDDQWAIFTTDDVDSEIGVFDESRCSYRRIVNSKCLNFKKSNLITGAYKQRYDCEDVVYWDDGLNPSRYLNINDIPWKENCVNNNGCITCSPIIGDLNCEKIRIAPLIVPPCIQVEKGKIAGTLPNGSYQICLAYTINQVKITDYLGLSEVQPLFNHLGDSSSLEIKINQIDKVNFEEFELVAYATINLKTYAKRIGYYSTSQGIIYLDRWDPEFPTVPLELIPVRNEPIERTDFTFQLNNYLLRCGTYSKYKFNYQPQANNIVTKWVAVEYPQDYYYKGGNNAGYMRDEQYAFFIRFVHNTGERTESYHIPGRGLIAGDNQLIPTSNLDVFEPSSVQKWQMYNTGFTTGLSTTAMPDGGVPVAEGFMGYWESETEFYPDKDPIVWGNLCGQKIRHHKMPDETVDQKLQVFNNLTKSIVLLGVKFENITPPLDEFGNPIQSIVAYEILRGSREGNKTILAKGIINNMFEYPIPGNSTVRGLYQNYPYNDLSKDIYITHEQQGLVNNKYNGKVTVDSDELDGVKKNIFSFHGPDVSFNNPFLSTNELKLYTEYNGTQNGTFKTPFRHPRFKLLSNTVGALTNLIGLIDKISSIAQFIANAVGGNGKTNGLSFEGTEGLPLKFNYGDLVKPQRPKPAGGDSLPGSSAVNYAIEVGLYFAELIGYVAQVAAFFLVEQSLIQAKSQKLLDIFTYLVPVRQYARQYISHGFYDRSRDLQPQHTRRAITQANYVFPGVQQFGLSRQINNIHRSQFVALELNRDLNNPLTIDASKEINSTGPGCGGTNYSSNISSYYGALKIPIPNQYGQLWSIKQLPISSNCLTNFNPAVSSVTSPVLFGGDSYITRFTEKNTMFFFDWWLMGEPDEALIDYTLYFNIPYPRFWINTEPRGNLALLTSTIFGTFPSMYRCLDCNFTSDSVVGSIAGGKFAYVDRGYFYLFNSGVRDFYVESEVNVALRDWEDEFGKRHYDPYAYTDIDTMFRSDLIKNGNFYKYDYSLSVSKLPGSSITWGNMFDRSYDPQDAASCFKYTPNRLIYSFPSDEDAPTIDRKKQDGWRIYLPNNNKDFESPITSLKPINKTGVLFLMNGQSPLMFTGQEQLNMTDTGTVITIGTGDLFKNTVQNVLRTEDALEYGSCQNRLSVISSLHGVFWVSQNQGKIFQFSQGMDEITRASGLKMWFSKNLQSQLLKSFPDYKHYDNPVKGIGVITSYDNTFELFYVSKKDYKLINPAAGNYVYDVNQDKFYFNNVEIQLGDPQHFETVNWTASYDPKSKQWISFHDWIPSFYVPSRLHFSTIKDDAIWKHNIRCDSYCNFYGDNYPFEIEYVSATGQTVNSLRSVEYLLETYKYHNNCYDKYHVLDENFDQAIIYNSEQISGVLNLNIKSKTNPLDVIRQPIINPNSIDILYSKEENKYRFNQFWDITKDRGEFNNINIPMFITEPNGYEYNINPAYVNYNKPVLQRKKFRHNVNRVFLRKTVSGDNNMLFKISNQKHLNSPR
jgi:hypothetical protein